MKHEITIRNCTLGSGYVKICIPIVAKNQEEVVKQCELAMQLPCDVLEIRLDYFENMNMDDMKATFKKMKEITHDKIILATFRSLEEGGQRSCSNEEYEALYSLLIYENGCDMIDLEYSKGLSSISKLHSIAQQNGVFTIISSHDFKETKSSIILQEQLQKMADLGMDMVKLAVMPKQEEDVRRLMDVAKLMSGCIAQPLIVLAMDELGKRTRIECEDFASCMSFAVADKASAPGQMGCREVRLLLDEFHVMKVHSKS